MRASVRRAEWGERLGRGRAAGGDVVDRNDGVTRSILLVGTLLPLVVVVARRGRRRRVCGPLRKRLGRGRVYGTYI